LCIYFFAATRNGPAAIQRLEPVHDPSETKGALL
jgi:hypothetical protein